MASTPHQVKGDSGRRDGCERNVGHALTGDGAGKKIPLRSIHEVATAPAISAAIVTAVAARSRKRSPSLRLELQSPNLHNLRLRPAR